MLPPLSALRTFDTAARHLSFTKAAEELCVTQSAVSRQIRLLEDFLELKLFERRHRSLTLTAEGERYQRDIAGIFAQMDLATRQLRRDRRRETLKIQTYTTFTMRWLIPRLGRFHEKFPEIEVQLTASLKPVDFTNSDIHGAVRAGRGEWPVRADKLCDTYLVPVCSPELARTAFQGEGAATLEDKPLLHSLGRPNDWQVWCKGAGMPYVDLDRGHRFESSSMSYQAALQGLGVAIGQRFLVEDDLRSGLLVAPLDLHVHSDETYYFMSSPRYAGTPRLELFREWLMEEARTTSHSFEPSGRAPA